MCEIISRIIQVPFRCRLEISLPEVQMIEIVVFAGSFELDG